MSRALIHTLWGVAGRGDNKAIFTLDEYMTDSKEKAEMRAKSKGGHAVRLRVRVPLADQRKLYRQLGMMK